eukprot:CAMPEP_0115094614 /NCGR_PEP_ID=MMETSP0227-20121206/28471_1 /TAXON_ID=89957 /ORGANISM="Polarella glacialis, Strain CCMP 1383" /LENGTH=625 /DNA_ID=CAMNT_0002487667 /DNA_START=28 /DNA_END=1908 /DNA_ORIENTATION=-
MGDISFNNEESDASDAAASLNSIVLTGSLLALIAIGYRINTHRLKHVPESGAAIALGFAIGIIVRVFKFHEEESLLNFRGGVFFYVLLPPIIFEAGLSLKTQLFVDNLGSILAFAVVGTVISTWVVSCSLRWAAESGLVGMQLTPRLPIYCHLFGALISATDPVATIALFGSSRFRTDPLLHALINGESVLNDAVAIVLFTTLSHHLDEEEPRLISASIMGHFCLVSLGSLAIGLAAGAVLSWVFCQSQQLDRFPDYEISAMFLGAYLTFALSQLLGMSGITSLFFFGVVLAQYNWYNLSDTSKVASKVAFETIAKLAEACVFVYLGVMAAVSLGRFHWHLGLVIFSVLSITVARAAHVFPLTLLLNLSRKDRKITNNMSVVMWVSGLRGAIAFSLALRLPCENNTADRGSPDCRNSDLLVTTTISIVVLTTLVIGTAMEKIATVLRVIEPADQFSALSEPLAGFSELANGEEAPRSPMKSMGNTAGSQATSSTDQPPLKELLRSFSAGSGSTWAMSRKETLRTLHQLRFTSRAPFYQAFARFDLEVLQPMFGGPCRSRVAGVDLPSPGSNSMGGAMSSMVSTPSTAISSMQQERRETVELPKYQELSSDQDDEAPMSSRSVIFE